MSKKSRRRRTKKQRKPRARIARAELDSTAINPRTIDYYRDAINESAAETFDQYTRETAQARGQHEFLNDPLFYGACQKIAALTCGNGPALKIEGPLLNYGEKRDAEDAAKAQYLEHLFRRFSEAVDVLADLRLIETELLYHGEAFLRKIPSTETTDGFDYTFIRPERVNDPPGAAFDPLINDGVLYDRDDDAARPIAYYVQRETIKPFGQSIEYEIIPAGEIIHIYNRIIPQQRRGVPECQSALGLIRELKLIRHLEIQAVKNSAKTAVILHSDAPQILDYTTNPNEDGEIEIPRPGPRGDVDLTDGLFIAPPGYEPTFGDAKHPASGYDVFKRTIAADVGASLGIGSGKANNDHSAYNFSSAKMDEQVDAVVIGVRQQTLARRFLDVLFNDWLLEAARRDEVAAEFCARAGAPENVERRWLFPAPRSIDRLKDAQADQLELTLGTITREQILARRGQDAEEIYERQKQEAAAQAQILNADLY